MRIKIYSGLAVAFVVVAASMVIFEPKAAPPERKEVELKDVYHLPCGFEAESYEPAQFIDGIRYPMECGCSELKGTCFRQKEEKYTLPDWYFKEEQ